MPRVIQTKSELQALKAMIHVSPFPIAHIGGFSSWVHGHPIFGVSYGATEQDSARAMVWFLHDCYGSEAVARAGPE